VDGLDDRLEPGPFKISPSSSKPLPVNSLRFFLTLGFVAVDPSVAGVLSAVDVAAGLSAEATAVSPNCFLPCNGTFDFFGAGSTAGLAAFLSPPLLRPLPFKIGFAGGSNSESESEASSSAGFRVFPDTLFIGRVVE